MTNAPFAPPTWSGPDTLRACDVQRVSAVSIIPFIEGFGVACRSGLRRVCRALSWTIRRNGEPGQSKLQGELVQSNLWEVWADRHRKERLYRATLQAEGTALRPWLAGIKRPWATPVGGGIRSLNVASRQRLDLYSCLRPMLRLPGMLLPVKDPANVDMVIFRENTEDINAGIESERRSAAATKFRNLNKARYPTRTGFPECSGGLRLADTWGSGTTLQGLVGHACPLFRGASAPVPRCSPSARTFLCNGARWAGMRGSFGNCTAWVSREQRTRRNNRRQRGLQDQTGYGRLQDKAGYGHLAATHKPCSAAASQAPPVPARHAVIARDQVLLRTHQFGVIATVHPKRAARPVVRRWSRSPDCTHAKGDAAKGLDSAIGEETPTYDFRRLMERAALVKCVELAAKVNERME